MRKSFRDIVIFVQHETLLKRAIFAPELLTELVDTAGAAAWPSNSPTESCFLPLTFTAVTPDKSFAFQTHCLQQEFSDFKGTGCPGELINLRNQIFLRGPNLYRERSTALLCASSVSAGMKTQLALGHQHLLIWPEYYSR